MHLRIVAAIAKIKVPSWLAAWLTDFAKLGGYNNNGLPFSSRVILIRGTNGPLKSAPQTVSGWPITCAISRLFEPSHSGVHVACKTAAEQVLMGEK
jgi:hypothetical protein